MSFQDSAFIFFIALLLFGPKKLPELARQLGKLMGEFRRASNEFRMQLEDELRTSEQEEKQKKIAALAAATPPVVPAAIETTSPLSQHELATDAKAGLEPSAPSELALPPPESPNSATDPSSSPVLTPSASAPIATAGALELHPPSTGLPVSRNSGVVQAFDSLPEAAPDRSASAEQPPTPPHQPDQQEPAHHG